MHSPLQWAPHNTYAGPLDCWQHPRPLAPPPPEEDKVSLVVEGDHPPAPELRVLVEQAAQHATHPTPQSGVEVVQQQLRLVPTDATVTLRQGGGGGRKEGAHHVQMVLGGGRVAGALLTNR
jgi:hypothetical protein